MTATEPTPAERTVEPPQPRHHGLDLGRIAWIVTTATLLVGVLVLALKRDWGYAAVSLAVALSAAINLI